MNISQAIDALRREIIAARTDVTSPEIAVYDDPAHFTRGYWGDYQVYGTLLNGREWKDREEEFWMRVKIAVPCTNPAGFDYWLPLVLAHAFKQDGFNPDMYGTVIECFLKRIDDHDRSWKQRSKYEFVPREPADFMLKMLSPASVRFLKNYFEIIVAIAERDGLDEIQQEVASVMPILD